METAKVRKIQAREKRQQTLSHYNGTVASLIEDTGAARINQRIRTFSQSTRGDIFFALRALCRIKGAALVVHGGQGCAAAAAAWREEEVYWYSTNLDEKDTILGGDEKLRKTIEKAWYQHHPEVIFVIGTPINAINNDDVQSVIQESEEQFGIGIHYIYTDGFHTKAGLQGFDIVSHILLKYVIPAGAEKGSHVNLVSFSQSSENIRAVVALFAELRIPYLVLPQFSDLTRIRKASAAAATFVLDHSEGGLLAQGLEETHQVPYIRIKPPTGWKQTEEFVHTLGRLFGREEEAASLLERQKRIRKLLSRQPLAGKKIFLHTTPELLEGAQNLIEEAGGIITGIGLPQFDGEDRELLVHITGLSKRIPILVGDGQVFELQNMLKQNRPDLFIGPSGCLYTAGRLGIAALSVDEAGVYGFAGMEALLEAWGRLGAVGKEEESSVYKAGWLKKSPGWYVKQEVL